VIVVLQVVEEQVVVVAVVEEAQNPKFNYSLEPKFYTFVTLL